jgi:hypothetical protein
MIWLIQGVVVMSAARDIYLKYGNGTDERERELWKNGRNDSE